MSKTAQKTIVDFVVAVPESQVGQKLYPGYRYTLFIHGLDQAPFLTPPYPRHKDPVWIKDFEIRLCSSHIQFECQSFTLARQPDRRPPVIKTWFELLDGNGETEVRLYALPEQELTQKLRVDFSQPVPVLN